MKTLKETALKSYTNLVSFFPLLSTEDMKNWQVLAIIKNANNLFNLLSILKDEKDERLPEIIRTFNSSAIDLVYFLLKKDLDDTIKELDSSISYTITTL